MRKEFRCGGNNISRFKKIMSASKITHQATSFTNKQHACSHIPDVQTQFPETIETTSSNVRQIKCRRSGAANTCST